MSRSIRLAFAAVFVTLVALPAAAQMRALSDPVVAHPDPESLFTSRDKAIHRNKQAALHIMRELLQCNHWKDADRWMSKDYIQHNPNLPTGREPVVQFFSRIRRPAERCERLTSALVAVVAQGDLVTVVWRMECPDSHGKGRYTSSWFNLWRIENGQVAEHWDPAMKAPLTCQIG